VADVVSVAERRIPLANATDVAVATPNVGVVSVGLVRVLFVSVCVSDNVATVESMANCPEVYVNPVPADRWARTSVALGPVYVMTPVDELYDKLPSPLTSDTEMAPRARASVKYLFVGEPASATSSAVNVRVPPNDTDVPLMVILLFVNELLAILLMALQQNMWYRHWCIPIHHLLHSNEVERHLMFLYLLQDRHFQ
jgi:hypothetical protein